MRAINVLRRVKHPCPRPDLHSVLWDAVADRDDAKDDTRGSRPAILSLRCVSVVLTVSLSMATRAQALFCIAAIVGASSTSNSSCGKHQSCTSSKSNHRQLSRTPLDISFPSMQSRYGIDISAPDFGNIDTFKSTLNQRLILKFIKHNLVNM